MTASHVVHMLHPPAKATGQREPDIPVRVQEVAVHSYAARSGDEVGHLQHRARLSMEEPWRITRPSASLQAVAL